LRHGNHVTIEIFYNKPGPGCTGEQEEKRWNVPIGYMALHLSKRYDIRVIVMARHRYCILILCFIACLAMATPRVCRGAESGPFSFDVLNTEKLTMRFTHQDGIHQNTTSLPLPVEVTSLCTQSAVIESQLVRERLTFKAELSQSALNDETTDIRMDSLDKAWRAQLLARVGSSAGDCPPGIWARPT
jgi:hypothetical protein